MTVTVCRSGQLTFRSGGRCSRPALGDLVTLTTRHPKKGDKIRLNGLGILQVRKRAARMGRNPVYPLSTVGSSPSKFAGGLLEGQLHVRLALALAGHCEIPPPCVLLLQTGVMILPSGNSTGLRGFRLRLGRQEGLSVMAGCNMASGAVRLNRDARWLGSGLRHRVLVRDFPFGLSFRSRMATGYHGVGQARSAVGAAETQIDDRDVAASIVNQRLER